MHRDFHIHQGSVIFFFFNDTATTEIYTLSLHDALPIYDLRLRLPGLGRGTLLLRPAPAPQRRGDHRSEEHTSELQSHHDLVCRLLLEKKKKQTPTKHSNHNNHNRI